MIKMSAPWPVKSLSELCEFRRGVTYKKADQVELSSTPVLRATNISLDSNALILDDLRYISDEFVVPENKRVVPDSILMCISSGSKKHLGKVAYVENIEPLAFGGFMGLLIPKREVYPKYLYYSLVSPSFKDWVAKLSDGTNINNLNFSKIENFQICLPPLDEQQRIVSALDQIILNIENQASKVNQKLLNDNEIYKSSLNLTFTNKTSDWTSQLLGDIISLEYGKPLPKEERDPEGAFPVYGANGEKARSNKFYHSIPTIVVGRKGSAGELNLTESKFWPLDVTYFVTYDEEKYVLKFLYYLLKTCNLPSMAKGVKPGINRNDVYALKVRTPSRVQQKKLVENLDSISNNFEMLKQNRHNEIKSLVELKQSILQEAFNGKL